MSVRLSLTTALFCICFSAFAEDDNPLLAKAQDEQELLFSELPSVFTASRHEQPIAKAPASVDVINAEQIKRYGWKTLSAMLSSLPGFISTYDRAYQHTGVRGFAPPGDYNTRILVLIDGHRVNESLQDYAGLGQDFLVDMADIDRVEVVRGPASALYGSNAVFAVINVFTQRGRDLQGTRLAGEVASYDSHRGQVSYGKKFNNGLETFFSASHYHSDGHEALYYPGLGTARDIDEEEVQRLRGKFSWEDFTLSGSWMGRKKHLPTSTSSTIFNDPDTNYRDRRAYADLNYHHNFVGDWDVTARVFWDSYDFDDQLPYRNQSGRRVVNRDLWQGQWYGAEFLLSHEYLAGHRTTLGSEFRQNYLQRITNSDVEPYVQMANNSRSSSVWGLFIQDEWSLLDNLTLQSGGRFDHYDSFGGTFNPHIGLIYEPLDGTTLKFLYGTAFRAPNSFETNYSCCDHTANPWINNPHLRPEQIETFELVWEQRLNAYFDLRVSPYYNELNDLIKLSTADNGVQQFVNQSSATAHGVETQLKGRYDLFDFRLSHTYQRSKLTSMGQIPSAPNAPEHMIKFNVSAPIWTDKIFAGLELQYVSPRVSVSGSRLQDYTVTNVTLYSRRWLPGLEVTGGIYNLFNERYSDPASPPITTDVVSQDGRNLRLRFSYEF